MRKRVFKDRIEIDIAGIVELCSTVLPEAATVLSGYDPTNPRVDKETLLLWEFCRVLFPRLGRGRFQGTPDRGAPTLSVDAWQKIIDVFDGRIREGPHPNDIVAAIRANLLEPALREIPTQYGVECL
jgi:hypothetical protein